MGLAGRRSRLHLASTTDASEPGSARELPYCPSLGSKNPRLPGDHFQYVGVTVAPRIKPISGTMDERDDRGG